MGIYIFMGRSDKHTILVMYCPAGVSISGDIVGLGVCSPCYRTKACAVSVTSHGAA